MARPRFLTSGDWHTFVNANKPITGGQLREFRKGCYQEIEAVRGRPLLVYAADFLGCPPGSPVSIDLNDVDGFADLIASIGAEQTAVDVLVQSPGGSADATERIVGMLRRRFQEVGFLVPHSAYSAATMLVLSGNEVILHPAATLGPIDPQVNGIPARQIRRGFDKVRDLLKEEGPEALPAYLPLLEKLTLELLELCDDAESLSKELVCAWLLRYMFSGDVDEQQRIDEAVDYFANYDNHKTHARPITPEKLTPLGLKITVAEDPLAQLMREAHILLTGFFGASAFAKLYENSSELSWGRQVPQHLLASVPPPPSP